MIIAPTMTVTVSGDWRLIDLVIAEYRLIALVSAYSGVTSASSGLHLLLGRYLGWG